MKNKRIISSFIAICSSVMIGTATLTASAAGAYDIEKDAWKFLNTSNSFGYSYSFTEQDGETHRSRLTNVDRRIANDLISSHFMGSCYGMSVTSILASYGLIDYNDYTEGADSLYTMSAVETPDDMPSDEIQSLINYYVALQATEEVRQYAAYSMLEQSDAERFQQLVQNAEEGTPSLVCYYGKNESGDLFGHAIVVYGVEYGQFESDFSDKTFTGRLLVYNCNTGAETSYIYFDNEKTWETENCSSEDGGRINLVISDISLLNNKGLLRGTEKYNNDRDFLAMLSVKSLLPTQNVNKISFANGKWETIDSTEGEIIKFPTFLGDVPQIYTDTYVLKDSESGYVFSTDVLATMNLEMNYQDCLMLADVNAANQVVFDPSGYIEMTGDTPYGFEMAMNDGYYNGSWYSFRIDQNTDTKHSALMRTDEGYILSSDNLNGTVITTCNGEKVFKRQIIVDSKLNLDSILIFEKTDGSIDYAADLDKNGSYETVLHEIATGDANNNGVLDVADVVLLQKWLLAVPDTHLPYWQLVDMNYDNRLDVFDLCLQKRALLKARNEVPPPFNEAETSQWDMLNIDYDESYDNITATALQSTYTTDTTEISCDIRNHNKGKGFFYFPIPFLEKYDNGEWIQIYNADPSLTSQYYDGYSLCGIAYHEHDDIEFGCRLKIFTKNLFPSLKEGHYRFKIYTAKNILYAEFDVVAAEQ